MEMILSRFAMNQNFARKLYSKMLVGTFCYNDINNLSIKVPSPKIIVFHYYKYNEKLVNQQKVIVR